MNLEGRLEGEDMDMMRGLVVHEDGSTSIETMPKPKYTDYQALVKVTAGSLCGTDMKILHNNLKGFSDYPTILGHESVGIVVELGKKVKNFKAGDKVVLPYIFDKSGEYYSTWGALGEYAVIGDTDAMLDDGQTCDDGTLFEFNYAQRKIPFELDDVAATMIVTFREVYSTMLRLGFSKGKSIVVYGAGPVGLTFITLCKKLGLGPIICVDLFDEKIEQAKILGASYGFNAQKVDVSAEILKVLPNKVDILLDAAGVPALINQNLLLVKDYGDVCIYGVTPKNEALINWENAPYNFNLKFSQ